MSRIRAFFVAAAALALATAPCTAHAANILFVSDAGGDSEIAAVLTMDGHVVTIRSGDFATGNMALRADLSGYDAVFWSASGSGYGDAHSDAMVFTNLTAFVTAGGRVFVTGYDSIASPTDPMLIAFLGGTGSIDVPGAPGAVTMAENSLSVGVVDVRGVVPTGGYGDRDSLTGLTSGTVAVVTTSGGTDAQWSLRTLGGGEIAYVSNGASGSGTTPSWSTTTTGGAGAYNAAIRNFAHAAEGASLEPGAPRIELDSVYSADEGAEIVVTVMVSDDEGDPTTWSWDLDDDGTFGEMPGAATYTIPAGTTDGDSTIRLAVQASDGTHTSSRQRTIRIANVAPRITSAPPVATSVGANVRYAVVVDDPGGALDPPTFAIVRGPMGAAFTAGGTFAWIPTELDVTLPGERTTIEIAVDDGDGGTATQVWEMTVSPNRAPDGLSLVYPAAGLVIADPTPRLVVSNGTDPDLEDVLVYYFQLDDDPEFTEPLLVDSGEVESGVGYTAFPLTTPLEPGVYHWRAWMSDGAVVTEPLATSFRVVPDPRLADAGSGETDGGAIEVDAGTTATRDGDRGCSCRAAGAGERGHASSALALVAIVGIVIARRRR